MALPKAHRLRHRRDFAAVYQQGTRHNGPHLVLRALPLHAADSIALDATRSGSQGFETLIGISVSQKVSKRAVVRNQIKRRIRAALRHLLPRIAPGWRLVIGVRANAVQCEYGQFLQELEQLLADAEVLHGR